MHSTPLIVITGGPCAGKTTAIPRVRGFLATLGYTVFIAPEAATMLIQNNIIPRKTASNELFQEVVFWEILAAEKRAREEASTVAGKSIILCDRGLYDGLAYTTPEHFDALLQKYADKIAPPREHYHAVMHLTTSAIDAEEYYTCANNSARSETLDEARILDARTRAAWKHHPNIRVIPNKAGRTFDQKIDLLIQEILTVLR